MDIYQEKLFEHYQDPHNFGLVKNPSYKTNTLENLSCGDSIKVQLLIDEEGFISDARFDGEGCAVSIATASMLTDFVKGKTTKDVENIDIEQLMKIIGIQLTLSRIKCANLSLEAIKAIIKK